MQISLTNRKRTLIFINLLITGIASSMLSTAMTTALPPVIADFGISVNTGQWITSGYSLVMAISMPLAAFLISKFPTKKLYIFALSSFIMGLLISMVSGNFVIMMIGRVCQAFGGGMLTSLGQVIILSIYPTEKKGTMMGYYGLATAGAPVISPPIAGVLVDSVGWRAIFSIPLVIMLLSLIWASMVMENVFELQNKKFDIISFIESIFVFGGITLGIGNLSSYGIVHVQTLLPLGLGVVTAILFTYRQLHMETPFLDIATLKIKGYLISVIGSMLLYMVIIGSSVLLPLYVQSIMGYSATISGLVTLPGSLVTALASPFAGKIYDKIGVKKLFIIGSICMLLSNLGMFFISHDTPLIVASLLNVIRGGCSGAMMMPLLTWGTSHMENTKVADATALLSSFRTLAGSIGSAVFVGIMTLISKMSADTYGNVSQMHGMNVSYLFMAITSGIMLLVAIYGTKETQKKK